MARLFTASSDHDISDMTGTPITGLPVSISCWFRTSNLADGQYLFQIQDQSEPDERLGIIFRGEIDDSIEIYQQSTANGYDLARSGTFVSSGTWHHACAIIENSTSRRIYLDGVAGTTGTATNTPSGLDSVSIGRARDSTPGFSFDGDIAEVAVWNVDINQGGTAANAQRLAKNFSPLSVLPEGLVFYADLIDDLREIIQGFTLTNNGTTVSEHPRQFKPFFFNPIQLQGDFTPPFYQTDGADMDIDTAGASQLTYSMGGQVADSSTGMMSFWYVLNSKVGSTRQTVFHTEDDSGAGMRLYLRHNTSSNRWQFSNQAPFGKDGTFFYDSTAQVPDGDWHHMLIAWDITTDISTSTIKMYIDDVKISGSFSGVQHDDGVVAWSNEMDDGFVIGAQAVSPSSNPSTLHPWLGCLAEVWIHHADYRDPDTDSNRRKFVTANLFPVSLGSDGSTPTGTSPLVYCYTGWPNFNFNSGIGPNFDHNPRQIPCATSPSDGSVVPLTVTKSYDDTTRGTGERATLTVSLDNTANPADATNVVFSDPLPTDLVIATPSLVILSNVTGTVVATAGSSTIALTEGVVPAGMVGTIDIDVESSVVGVYLNSVNVTSDFGVSAEAQATVTYSQSAVNHCLIHKFVYRPDTRVYPLSETHCPIGNHLLPNWRSRVNGDEDSEVFDIDYDDY